MYRNASWTNNTFELIEIFNVYSIKDLKEKYLTEAKNLKCTINDRFTNTKI
jgi:hypothetical protein